MAHEELIGRTFVELADTLVDDFDVVELLTLLVDRSVELLDATAAGLLLTDGEGTLRLMASTSEAMKLVELFQAQNEQGPCLECCNTGEPVIVEDLKAMTERWPSFVPFALSAGFAVMAVVRDAEWVVVLGLMAGALLTTSALTNGRSAVGILLGALAWPFAGLRGLPWLGRTMRSFGGGRNTGAVIRTAVISLLGLLVFGVLFASGDAIFGQWVSAVLPDVQGRLLFRVFVMLAVAGTVLAGAYLALNPPAVNVPSTRRPAQHRFEWLAPVLLVDAVFVLFLAAQAAAFFGGHGYIRQVTGLTYADYVHQGFAQLTIATLLTLLVVWAAARKAGTAAADRWWLRGSLGALCLLTLVVVASALHRMDLYQGAYGFTRLRLLVDLFEGWLGLLVLAVLVAGIGLRGGWLPRMALLSGSVLLLGLAVVNPDAWIAQHNLERYQATGKVDYSYLRGLSLDAAPVLVDLPPGQAACALGNTSREGDPWAGWNLARARARDALATFELPPGAGCNEHLPPPQ